MRPMRPKMEASKGVVLLKWEGTPRADWRAMRVISANMVRAIHGRARGWGARWRGGRA